MAIRIQQTPVVNLVWDPVTLTFPTPVAPGQLIMFYADIDGGNASIPFGDHVTDDIGNTYQFVARGNWNNDSPVVVGWAINAGPGNVTEINVSADPSGSHVFSRAMVYAEEWEGKIPTQSWVERYYGSRDKFLTTPTISNVPGTAVVALGAWGSSNPETGWDFVPPGWTRMAFQQGDRTALGTSRQDVAVEGTVTADFTELDKSDFHWIIVFIEDEDSGPSGPTIDTQPTSQTVTAPASAEFGPVAATGEGTLSYQWRYREGSEGTPANVDFGTGGTSTTFNTGVNTTGRSGWQFQVQVTDDNGTTDSDWATLTVNPAAAPVLTSPVALSPGQTTVTPRVTTDTGNGTLYYVLYPGAQDDASAAQVVAGEDATGSAAISAGSASISETGTVTFSQVTGLTPSTSYKISFVHEGNPDG